LQNAHAIFLWVVFALKQVLGWYSNLTKGVCMKEITHNLYQFSQYIPPIEFTIH